MYGLNFHNSQRLSYFSPSKWSKKGIKKQFSKPFSFFFNQRKNLLNSRATLSPKSSSPTVHQIKQKSAATKCGLLNNAEEYYHLFLPLLCTCSIYYASSNSSIYLSIYWTAYSLRQFHGLRTHFQIDSRGVLFETHLFLIGYLSIYLSISRK